MGALAPAPPMDFAELTRTLWRGRWTIILTVAVLMALAITYSLLAKPIYRADVVLSPVSEDSMRPSLGALGGLASLAGINIGAGNKSVEAVAILKSKGFAREFIETQKIMEPLLEARGGGSGMFGGAPQSKDIRLAVESFDRGVRRVSEDRKTGLVTLSIQWEDGTVAAAWANAVVRQLNDRMRQRALVDSQNNVTYLQKELATTTVVSLQQAIGRLLESEMQKLMLARGNDEFAFKIIDAAAPPRRPFWPRPVLATALAMLLGGIFSSAYVLLRGKS
jgi:uncharacterized protein involved in exopolysaccharide biosynthesis